MAKLIFFFLKLILKTGGEIPDKTVDPNLTT